MKRLRSLIPGCVFFAMSIALAVSAAANSAVEPVPRDSAWLERHAAFAAEAKRGGIDVLFLGDSITDFWRDTNPERGGKEVWDANFAPLHAANFGISGDRTQHVLWRLRNGEGEGFQPKVVVLMIGTNNTGFERGGKNPRNTVPETIEGVTAVVRELRTRFPAAKVLLLAIFPRGGPADARRLQVVEINKSIERLHDGEHVFWLDIGSRFLDADGSIPTDVMPDLLHPSLKGYRIWAEAIKEPLARLLR